VLKFGSKCPFIPDKLRFFAEFCLILPALITFFNTLSGAHFVPRRVAFQKIRIIVIGTVTFQSENDRTAARRPGDIEGKTSDPYYQEDK
jgi:hypothetical protein